MRRVQIKPNGKKKSKTINSKKKTGTAKYGAFSKEEDGCKETIQLACSLHIQELRDLVKVVTKNYRCIIQEKDSVQESVQISCW